MFETMTYTKKNEEAVSPVIGVILMVAVTVILAAVIAAFVFGMAGNMQKSKVVAATADHRAPGGTQTLRVTYQGGPDAGQVSSMAVTFNTNAATTLSTNVGTAVSTTTGVLSSNDNHVVVAATFFDGTSQVILDTFV